MRAPAGCSRGRASPGVAVLAAAATWFVPRALHAPAKPGPVRFAIPRPEGFFLNIDGAWNRLSPDGRSLAFIAYDSTGGSRLWPRSLASTVAKPIAGTDKVDGFFFRSPDGRQIAFVSEGKLRRISVAGGEAEVVCPVKAERGGSWSGDGVILTATTSNGPIYRVPASGGEPQPVTTLDSTRGETAHRYPQFLPDGRHFLFSVLPARGGKFETCVGSLDSPKRQLVLTAGSGVTWAPPGHLLYARDGRLIAQGFDAKTLKLRGDPVSLGDAVNGTGGAGGPIAYLWSQNSPQVLKIRTLVGDTLGTFLDEDPLFKRFHGWTPDGRSLLFSRLDPETQWDLWVLPVDGDHTPRAYLRTRYNESYGNLSPDGRWMVYLSDESGRQEAYVQSYPVPGGKYQVTTRGALWAAWIGQGQTLAFGVSSDQMHGRTAEVLAGSEFRLGPSRVTITVPEDNRGVALRPGIQVLALRPAEADPIPSITVLLDGLPGATGR